MLRINVTVMAVGDGINATPQIVVLMSALRLWFIGDVMLTDELEQLRIGKLLNWRKRDKTCF